MGVMVGKVEMEEMEVMEVMGEILMPLFFQVTLIITTLPFNKKLKQL